MHAGPHRACPRRATSSRTAGDVAQPVGFVYFGLGNGFRQLHAQAQRLLLRGIDNRDGPLLELGVEAAEQASDLFQRPLRGGKADALKRFASAQGLQTLERQKQVGAALAGDQ